MKAVNEQMPNAAAELSAPPADATDATAQVVSVGQAASMMNTDPILPVQLLISEPGHAAAAGVGLDHRADRPDRVQPGATLPVKLRQSNPSALAVDWSAPA